MRTVGMAITLDFVQLFFSAATPVLPPTSNTRCGRHSLVLLPSSTQESSAAKVAELWTAGVFCLDSFWLTQLHCYVHRRVLSHKTYMSLIPTPVTDLLSITSKILYTSIRVLSHIINNKITKTKRELNLASEVKNWVYIEQRD